MFKLCTILTLFIFSLNTFAWQEFIRCDFTAENSSKSLNFGWLEPGTDSVRLVLQQQSISETHAIHRGLLKKYDQVAGKTLGATRVLGNVQFTDIEQGYMVHYAPYNVALTTTQGFAMVIYYDGSGKLLNYTAADYSHSDVEATFKAGTCSISNYSLLRNKPTDLTVERTSGEWFDLLSTNYYQVHYAQADTFLSKEIQNAIGEQVNQHFENLNPSWEAPSKTFKPVAKDQPRCGGVKWGLFYTIRDHVGQTIGYRVRLQCKSPFGTSEYLSSSYSKYIQHSSYYWKEEILITINKELLLESISDKPEYHRTWKNIPVENVQQQQSETSWWGE